MRFLYQKNIFFYNTPVIGDTDGGQIIWAWTTQIEEAILEMHMGLDNPA